VAAPAPTVVRVGDEPGPPLDGQRRTGVVWVHGIGTQKPGDSLFDWTRPILDVFAEWRRQYDADSGEDPIGENPVDSASVSDPDNRWIEVDIPGFGDRAHGQWLFTEAYWAGDVRPPSFGAASAYLLGHLRGIIKGIGDGLRIREDKRKQRIRTLSDQLAVELQRAGREPNDDPRWIELSLALQGRWTITDTLDGVWKLRPVRWALVSVGTVVAIVALGVYSLLHAIPIAAVQKRVEIAAADTFIVEWFGDLAVILDDLAQGAAIRNRLVERVAWLKRHDCDDVVLLAHSGGTIVSYATLLRYPEADLDVAKLVTFGEAIKLGWRLEHETGDWNPGNSVRGDLRDGHPTLRWVDVWASYDPAPSGPMEREEGCPLVAVDKLSVTPNPDRAGIEVESRPVTNFMHLALDHGGYWSNDEGFLIPVIRHIDDPRGNGDGSRFFHDPLDRTLRTERRRRRVALMLGWRWTAFAAAVAAIAGLIVGIPDATATGDSVARVWALLPGHEIVSGTVDGIGRAVAVILGAVGLTSISDWLGAIGPALLGTLVPLVAIVAIYGRGVRSWHAHDALERRLIRGESLRPFGLASARSEAMLVSGGLLAVVLASWLASALAVGICLVITAAVAAALRFVGNRPSNAAAVARVAAMTDGRR